MHNLLLIRCKFIDVFFCSFALSKVIWIVRFEHTVLRFINIDTIVDSENPWQINWIVESYYEWCCNDNVLNIYTSIRYITFTWVRCSAVQFVTLQASNSWLLELLDRNKLLVPEVILRSLLPTCASYYNRGGAIY